MLAEAKLEKNVGSSKGASRREYSVNSVNKDERIYIRVTEAEKKKLQEVSTRKGITMSRLIMDLLDVAFF